MTSALAAGADPHSGAGETSANWRAIGTSVHLIVTEPAALEPARQLAEVSPRSAPAATAAAITIRRTWSGRSIPAP